MDLLDRSIFKPERHARRTIRRQMRKVHVDQTTQRRPKAIWKDDVENDLRKMRIVKWGEKVPQYTDGWRRATGQRLTFPGQWNHSKRRDIESRFTICILRRIL